MILQYYPTIVYTYLGVDGITYFQVEMEDGSIQDMTQEQYEYLLASLKAVEELSNSPTDEQLASTSNDPANSRYELGDEVGESDELTQLPTVYAEYSSTSSADESGVSPLADVSNTFTEIMDWFGDTFFIEKTNTTTRTGYHSERYSYSSSYQIVQLPFEETVTEVVHLLNPSAIASAVVVVLTLITCFTWLKNAIFGRLS